MAKQINPTVSTSAPVKSALELMAEKMAEMERVKAEMEALKADTLEPLKKEKESLEKRLAEINETFRVLGLSGVGRPKMTEEEKAQAKLARENAKKSAEAAQVLGVLKGSAPVPANVVNIPVQPAPVEQLAMAK